MPRARNRFRLAVSASTALLMLAGLSACVPTDDTDIGQPGAGNTGVPAGTALTSVWGDVTVTQAGTVLDGLDIHGFVKVRAANVTIRNSKVHGAATATTSTALINSASPAVENLLIEHCDLTDDSPSIWVDGVMGHDYTARYNDVHNTVDGFGVFNPSKPSADLNVTIQANWVHDLNYMSPDQTHSDGHSHNDGVQIQGTGATHGRVQVLIVGNTIEAFAGPMSNGRSPYYPAVPGQAIAVTPNVSQVHDVVILGNWLDGGLFSVTMITGKKGMGGGTVLSNNSFGRGQFYKPVLVTSGVNIANVGNTYTDGKPVAVATH